MKNVNWLKIASFVGMGLGFIGTIISDYAATEQNKIDIKEEVQEQMRIFFESNNSNESA